MKMMLAAIVSYVLLMAGTATATAPRPPIKVRFDDKNYPEVVTQGQLLTNPTPEMFDRDRFLVAQDDDSLHAWNSDAKEVWKATPGKGPFKQLGSNPSTILISGDHLLAGLDWKTGNVNWKLALAKSDDFVTACDDWLATKTADGLEFHELASGRLLSKTPLGDGIDRFQAGFGHLTIVKAGSPDLTVIDIATGKAIDFPRKTKGLWFADSPSGTLFVLEERQLTAYDPLTKQQLWNAELAVDPLATAPIVGKGFVAVIDKRAKFNLFNLEGKTLPNPFENMEPTIWKIGQTKFFDDGTYVYYQTIDNLGAIDPRQGWLAWIGPVFVTIHPIDSIAFESRVIFSLWLGDAFPNPRQPPVLAAHDRFSGKLLIVFPLTSPSTGKPLAKNELRAWTVIQGAVALDLDGHVHMLRYSKQ
jgi:hypothetical protein